MLAAYAGAAPLASIATALRAQLAGLDKRAADSRPPAAPPPASELPDAEEAERHAAHIVFPMRVPSHFTDVISSNHSS